MNGDKDFMFSALKASPSRNRLTASAHSRIQKLLDAACDNFQKSGMTDSQAEAAVEGAIRSIEEWQVALVVDVEPNQSLSVTHDIDEDAVVETAIRTKADFLDIVDKDARPNCCCNLRA